uniref:Uncharacterized protein n=1 Tax=Pyricularia oryzae (strain P131) TaxID=1143193 RepID=L7IQ55_PYRO1
MRTDRDSSTTNGEKRHSGLRPDPARFWSDPQDISNFISTSFTLNGTTTRAGIIDERRLPTAAPGTHAGGDGGEAAKTKNGRRNPAGPPGGANSSCHTGPGRDAAQGGQPHEAGKIQKKRKPADFGRTINEDGLNMGTHKTAMSTAIDARTYPLMFDPTCALRDPLVAISGTAIINAGAATTKNSLNPAKVAMLKQQALRNKGYLDPKLGQSHVGDITTLSPMDGGLNYLFRMAEDPHLRPYTDGAQLAL